MIIDKERRRSCQGSIDGLRESAKWAREHAAAQPIDSQAWMRAMSVAQGTDAYADEMQAELDALPPS